MTPKLNFRIIGQGKPVIILHGLFGMLDNWLTIAKKLESVGYMSILIDQRDHGRSEHTDDFSYPLLANDLYKFMEENWIHESYLIGHSMGGKTALQFISEHESMISKLIIVDIGIKKYAAGHDDVFKALFAIDTDILHTRHQAENILRTRLHDNGTIQFLMKNLTRNKSGKYEWKMNLNLLYEKYDNILEEIHFEHPVSTKTLFIKGEKSDYILPEDFISINDVLPEASFSTILNAGHWTHADQPDELFTRIIDFITD